MIVRRKRPVGPAAACACVCVRALAYYLLILSMKLALLCVTVVSQKQTGCSRITCSGVRN